MRTASTATAQTLPLEAEFVLLEHSGAVAGPALHWDFLLALPGESGLRAWRLLQNPLISEGTITAEALPEHRRLYLKYEGPLSGKRGAVRRLDRGHAMVSAAATEDLRLQLAGERLIGPVRLGGGAWVWLRGG